MRVETPRQVVGERRLRDRERGFDVGFGRVRDADQEVLAHARREEGRLLEREADLGAQAAQREVAHVVPVERDPTAGRVVQAASNVAIVVLPAPVAPTSASVSPGLDREVDPAQHDLVGARIHELHALESNLAASTCERGRARSVGDERLGVEHLPTRPAAVSASSAIARIHASSSMGNTRINRYDTNATRPPTVRLPPDTANAPASSTAASVRFGIRPSTQMNCVWILTRSSSVSRSCRQRAS